MLASNEGISTEHPKYMEGTYWILVFVILASVGVYLIVNFIIRKAKIQSKVLQKKVERRTKEISLQKEELQKKSEELQKAYEEIQTKNTAIEEAFEHLSNSFTKLSDLNREKDGMMNIVAHDLRTPLNNIEGLIQLLSLNGNLNDDQQEYISKIRTVVKGGTEMIRDLLDINQAKNYKPELKITQFSMTNFIENWKANFEEPLLSKGQHLKISGDYKLTIAETDSGLLTRVMDNLMSNAMKFSERGKNIYLDISTLDNQLIVTIKDEGPGISERDQLKMFKPFTRLTARPTAGEHSNGLGLSIVESLTKNLGGEVVVNSTIGEGTTFKISIPLKVNEA